MLIVTISGGRAGGKTTLMNTVAALLTKMVPGLRVFSMDYDDPMTRVDGWDKSVSPWRKKADAPPPHILFQTVETGGWSVNPDTLGRAVLAAVEIGKRMKLHSNDPARYAKYLATGNPESQYGYTDNDLKVIQNIVDDIEAAAMDAPTKIQATLLMTRAQQLRDYTGLPDPTGERPQWKFPGSYEGFTSADYAVIEARAILWERRENPTDTPSYRKMKEIADRVLPSDVTQKLLVSWKARADAAAAEVEAFTSQGFTHEEAAHRMDNRLSQQTKDWIDKQEVNTSGYAARRHGVKLSRPIQKIRLEMCPAANLTDEELIAAKQHCEANFEACREGDGHGGSPGEYWDERLGEIETEMKRRLPPVDDQSFSITGEITTRFVDPKLYDIVTTYRMPVAGPDADEAEHRAVALEIEADESYAEHEVEAGRAQRLWKTYQFIADSEGGHLNVIKEYSADGEGSTLKKQWAEVCRAADIGGFFVTYEIKDLTKPGIRFKALVRDYTNTNNPPPWLVNHTWKSNIPSGAYRASVPDGPGDGHGERKLAYQYTRGEAHNERFTTKTSYKTVADRMANAIQMFRNEAALGRATKVRETLGFSMLIEAWEDYVALQPDSRLDGPAMNQIRKERKRH